MLPLPKSLAINESIIPYFGKHGLKQFIRYKSFRFKLQSLASKDGFLYHAKPYCCGFSTNLPTTGLGQGGNGALGLIEKAKIEKGHAIAFNK